MNMFIYIVTESEKFVNPFYEHVHLYGF